MIRRAAMQTVAAFLITGALLGIYIVPMLWSGTLSDLGRIPQTIPVFLAVSFALALLHQWLQRLDRHVEPVDLPPYYVEVGLAALVVLTLIGMVALAAWFDNVAQVRALAEPVLGLGILCAVIFPVIWSPLLIEFVWRRWWAPLLRRDSDKSSPQIDETAARSS